MTRTKNKKFILLLVLLLAVVIYSTFTQVTEGFETTSNNSLQGNVQTDTQTQTNANTVQTQQKVTGNVGTGNLQTNKDTITTSQQPKDITTTKKEDQIVSLESKQVPKDQRPVRRKIQKKNRSIPVSYSPQTINNSIWRGALAIPSSILDTYLESESGALQ